MNQNPIDVLLDRYNADPIVLPTADGGEMIFDQVAMIMLNGKMYPILAPFEPMDGVGDDEALVFVIDEVDGEKTLTVVEDEDTIDAVFAAYDKLWEEANSN